MEDHFPVLGYQEDGAYQVSGLHRLPKEIDPRLQDGR
jgi:hypothetical protein